MDYKKSRRWYHKRRESQSKTLHDASKEKISHKELPGPGTAELPDMPVSHEESWRKIEVNGNNLDDSNSWTLDDLRLRAEVALFGPPIVRVKLRKEFEDYDVQESQLKLLENSRLREELELFKTPHPYAKIKCDVGAQLQDEQLELQRLGDKRMEEELELFDSPILQVKIPITVQDPQAYGNQSGDPDILQIQMLHDARLQSENELFWLPIPRPAFRSVDQRKARHESRWVTEERQRQIREDLRFREELELFGPSIPRVKLWGQDEENEESQLRRLQDLRLQRELELFSPTIPRVKIISRVEHREDGESQSGIPLDLELRDEQDEGKNGLKEPQQRTLEHPSPQTSSELLEPPAPAEAALSGGEEGKRKKKKKRNPKPTKFEEEVISKGVETNIEEEAVKEEEGAKEKASVETRVCENTGEGEVERIGQEAFCEENEANGGERVGRGENATMEVIYEKEEACGEVVVCKESEANEEESAGKKSNDHTETVCQEEAVYQEEAFHQEVVFEENEVSREGRVQETEIVEAEVVCQEAVYQETVNEEETVNQEEASYQEMDYQEEIAYEEGIVCQEEVAYGVAGVNEMESIGEEAEVRVYEGIRAAEIAQGYRVGGDVVINQEVPINQTWNVREEVWVSQETVREMEAGGEGGVGLEYGGPVILNSQMQGGPELLQQHYQEEQMAGLEIAQDSVLQKNPPLRGTWLLEQMYQHYHHLYYQHHFPQQRTGTFWLAGQMYTQQYQQQPWLDQFVWVRDITRPFPDPILSLGHISPILYRVYDNSSVSQFHAGGFTSGSPYMPCTALEFRSMVELHANWKSRAGTPFISMTSTPNGADWQVAIRRNVNRANIMVALIDTAALLVANHSTIWEMHTAMDHYRVLPPGRCSRSTFNDEYICALQIPLNAVIVCCNPDNYRANALRFLGQLTAQRYQ